MSSNDLITNSFSFTYRNGQFVFDLHNAVTLYAYQKLYVKLCVCSVIA